MSRSGQISTALRRYRPEWPVLRATLAILVVVAAGTAGYMIIEGWGLAQSLFLTIITLTTIGYSDYGLSPMGQNFTTVLIIVGLSTFAYFAGQILPALFNPTFYRNRTMHYQITQLSDHFIVCGLGRIGRSVCARLNRENVQFVVIDADESAVERAREHGLLAIQGDATEDEVLEQLGIHQARGVVCVTSSDTENIVITLGARELNPNLLIISRAEDDDSVRKLMRAGATRIVSPSHSSGQDIINSILKPNLADLFEQSYKLNGDFAFCEVKLGGDSKIVGRSIDNCVQQYRDVSLVALKHGEEPLRFSPHGDASLDSGDVLIVAGEHQAIARLKDDAGAIRSAA